MSDDVTEELDERHLEQLRERVKGSPFHRWSGMELTSVGGGEAEIVMELDEDRHFNPQRIVHGGIISAVADTAIGLALRSKLRPGFSHRTAQLNVHFLSKGEGNRLVARGRAVHLGRRMGYGEAEVYDETDRLLARASATFIVMEAPGAF
ncbi:MAG: PaaI family thioesterase [Actinomycetota bacterium]